MVTRLRNAVLLAALSAVAVTACGDSPTGLPDEFDAAAVTEAVDAVLEPQRAAYEPTVAVRNAFGTLTELGVSYARADEILGSAGLLVPFGGGDARNLEFPTDLQGQTFVFDVDTETWASDSTRTEAPDSGIRVIWYSTTDNGTLIVPLVERGWVDLTDEDEGGARSAIGIRMVASTDTGDMVLGDFVESFEASGDSAWSQTLLLNGYFGTGADSVAFDITSTANGNTGTGDQQFSLLVEVAAPDLDYTLEIDGSEDGETGVSDQTVTATAVHDGATTRLSLDLSEGQDDVQTGSGTLAYRGETVVQVSVEGNNNYQYKDANGKSLPSGEVLTVDNLVRTIYVTGVRLLFDLPLLFF